VASALDYAHRQGVIHRDIKPENILLQEGEAILADFGIALAVRQAGGNRLTETGLSLGTPQYMSPEQATGDRTLDARSDVYSLGAVLYEMLTGEPPVTGATAQAMIAKLMTERPTRVRAVRDTVPQAVDDAIAKALAKVPADRYRGALEFSDALHAGLEGRGGAAVPPPHAARSRAPWYIAGAALLVALVAVVFTLGRGGAGAPAAPQYAPDRQVTFSGDVGRLALAPDGRTAAYVRQDRTTLMLLDLDGGGSQVVYSAPKGAVLHSIDWAPDGSRIFFILLGTAPQAWSIPRLGGETTLEVDLSHLSGLNGMKGAITRRGEWLLVSEHRLYLGTDPASLREEGGQLAGNGVIAVGERGQPYIQSAVADPDGRWIAFSKESSSRQASPPVSGVIGRDGASGPGPVPEWSGLRVLSWASDGSSVYLLRRAGSGWDLLRAPVDRRSGRPAAAPALVYPRLEIATEAWQSSQTEARVSDDGRRLVVVNGPRSTRIRVLQLDRTPDPSDNPGTVLSQGTAVWRFPEFLPGGRIAVAGLGQDGYDILALPADGGAPQLLARRRGVERPVDKLLPSPDGQTFALVEVTPASDLSSTLTLLSVATGRTQSIALPEPVSELSWSADGRHLGGMTARSADRVVTVDVAAGTARSVHLACDDKCEFAWETIAVGPEWPLAAVTSQVDTWVANLETGDLRHLASDTWTAVAWLGDWVYFVRQAGQTGQGHVSLFRVRAAGGKEERLIDLPADCEEPVAIAPDGKSVACAEITLRQDIHVIDDFDPAVAKK
jgi:dipeptidyl aminopeptidase/acylaminoacyl peptidase